MASIQIDGDAGNDMISVILSDVLLSGGTLNMDVGGASDNDTVAVGVQFQRSASVSSAD